MRYLTGLAGVATIIAVASAVSPAARAQTTDQPAAAPATAPVAPSPAVAVPTETPPQAPAAQSSVPAAQAPAPAAVAPVPPVVAPQVAAPVAPPPNGTPATVMDIGEVDGVLGRNVRSTAGDDMGRIVDVMVGGNGQVHAAIIDFGGFLGVGSRKVAVDWRALQFASEGKVGRITTGLSRNQIRLAPEYKNGEAVVVLNAPGAAPPAAAPAAAAAPAPAASPAPAAPAASPPGAAAPAPTADDASAQRPKPAP